MASTSALREARAFAGGVTDFIAVLDARRAYLQARRERINGEGRLGSRYVTINKVVGNTPPGADTARLR
ncbi:MAG: hypothetical protein LBL72_03405 [Candidatus Accumulibacter sp.]|jgi:outer membrane protein TolC|nr:hypothetical protein [Accumulibacter sp.]